MTDEGAVFISVLPGSGIACHTLKRERGERQTGGERGWERERERGREERSRGRKGGRQRQKEKNAYKHINGTKFPPAPSHPKEEDNNKTRRYADN